MSKKRKQKTGVCLFCGREGNLTKEHIWPDWISSALPKQTKHSQNITSYQPIGEAVLIKPQIPADRQGSMLQWKLRKVCRECNNGWMSRIVNESKPMVLELIRGNHKALTPDEMNTISAWIALTTVMAEFTDVKTVGIPSYDRRFIFNNKKPPESWTIFLGNHSTRSWMNNSYRHHGFIYKKLVSFPPLNYGVYQNESFQVTTYTLGNLVVHNFSGTDENLTNQLRTTWRPPALVKIWPNNEDIIFKPKVINKDKKLDFIADKPFAMILSTLQ